MMKKPQIFRKRYIPDEVNDISGDELVFRSDELLITKWKVIKPRTDFTHGESYAFLKEGYKISAFYSPEGEFIYWYCDIIDVIYDRDQDSYTLVDLLLDVVVKPDGSYKVLDGDELAEALEKGLVTKEQCIASLRKTDKILKMIYEGQFPPKVCVQGGYNAG